jgi:hypothetical protein
VTAIALRRAGSLATRKSRAPARRFYRRRYRLPASVEARERQYRLAVHDDLRARMKRLRIDDKVSLAVSETLRRVVNGEAIEPDGMIARQLVYVRPIIKVALTSTDPQWTLDHEAIHAMRHLGLFREREWKALTRGALADTERMEEVRARYAGLDLTEDQLIEECIADQFADWAEGRYEATGLVLQAFRRIERFLRGVRDVMTAHGYARPEDVFRKVDAGTVGKRTPREEARPGFMSRMGAALAAVFRAMMG